MSTEDQCVDDKLESAIENSDCDASLVEPLIVSLSDDYEHEDEQELLTGFRIFCTPECGKPILEVHDECNYFDDSPFLRELLVGQRKGCRVLTLRLRAHSPLSTTPK